MAIGKKKKLKHCSDKKKRAIKRVSFFLLSTGDFFASESRVRACWKTECGAGVSASGAFYFYNRRKQNAISLSLERRREKGRRR